MSTYCIPKSVAEEMKKAIKRGDMDLRRLFDSKTSSEERRSAFEHYGSPELAKLINTEAEKAIAEKQKGALQNWADNTFNPKEKKQAPYQSLVKKIGELDKIGVLNPNTSQSYLQDLVADKLGVAVSPQEVKNISEKASELEKAYNVRGDNNVPTLPYWEKRHEMDNYIQSLSPTSNLRVATSVIGRGNMLAHIPGVVSKTSSEIIQGGLQMLEKRLAAVATGQAWRGVNNEYAKKLIKENTKIFEKSGYSPATMMELSSGQKWLGEEITHSQGPGRIRAAGRFMEKYVFHTAYGRPADLAANFSFADTANIYSTQFAKKLLPNGTKSEIKAKALELFKEASGFDAISNEAKFIKSRGQVDAFSASFQNMGVAAKLNTSIRTAINEATGDLRMGDQLMPIVKTPSNVIENGLDYAGIAAIKGTKALGFKGWNVMPEAVAKWREGDKAPMQSAARLFIRAGLGAAFAAVIVKMINPDDFIGGYENLGPDGKALAEAKNAPFNSVKVGSKFISLALFGPLAPPIVAALYAKKYGPGAYPFGGAAEIGELPAFTQVKSAIDATHELIKAHDEGKLGEAAVDSGTAYLRARAIPAFVKELAAATDSSQRQTDHGQLSKVRSGIPGLRETLPVKTDQMTGENKKTEGFLSEMVFGSRVSTATKSKVIDEIDRLYNVGEAPALASISKNPSMVNLKKQVSPQQFQKAIKSFGESFGNDVSELIDSSDYDELSPSEKKNEINKIRQNSLNAVLDENDYEKPIKGEKK